MRLVCISVNRGFSLSVQHLKRLFAVIIVGYSLLLGSSYFFVPRHEPPNCRHHRVAVFVYVSNVSAITQQFKYNETALQFIRSAKQHFLTSHQCNSADVIYFWNFVEISSRDRNQLNPCRLFVSTAQLSQSSAAIDFVLIVDASVKIKGPIAIVEWLLGDLITVLHRPIFNSARVSSFLNQKSPDWKNNRLSLIITSMHYSSKFFGGKLNTVQDMCSVLRNSDSPGDFHRELNSYFQENVPSIVVRSKDPEELLKSDVLLTVKLVGDTLELPQEEDFEKDYNIELEINSEHRQAALHEETAEQVAAAIRTNYIGKIEKLYSNSNLAQLQENISNVTDQETILLHKFLTASCTLKANCGGFGDRLRGLVVSFYLAIATGRVFHVDQTKPVDLADYFELNDRLYHVSSNFYRLQRAESLANRSYVMNRMHAEQDFHKYLQSPAFASDLDNFTSIDLITNRYTGLAYPLLDRKFSFLVKNIAEYETENMEYGKFNFPVFISAALRVTLGRVSDRLWQLFHVTINSTIGFDVWNNAIKIGVQIRTQDLAQFQERGTRVRPWQINCFAEKVQYLIKERIRRLATFSDKPKIVIFVTADWKGAVDILRTNLSNVPNLTIFNSGEKQNLKITHVDQMNEAAHDKNAWQIMAKTYLDWVILTKMDFLVISRSGFGETASMMSLKPTWRFMHFDKNPRCPFTQYNLDMPYVVATKHFPVDSL